MICLYQFIAIRSTCLFLFWFILHLHGIDMFISVWFLCLFPPNLHSPLTVHIPLNHTLQLPYALSILLFTITDIESFFHMTALNIDLVVLLCMFTCSDF